MRFEETNPDRSPRPFRGTPGRTPGPASRNIRFRPNRGAQPGSRRCGTGGVAQGRRTHAAPGPAAVPEPSELIADILTEAQDHFRANRLTAAEAFLRLMPRPATPPGDTWRELGHLHFSLARYDEAGRAFGYAAAHRPDDADLQVDLALTCL